jgi:hypothetical protein
MEKAALGNFDDSGVNVTSIVKINGRKRFYYYGWNLGVTVPFRNSIGVAEEAEDGVMLKRLYAGPHDGSVEGIPQSLRHAIRSQRR